MAKAEIYAGLETSQTHFKLFNIVQNLANNLLNYY